MNKRFDLNSILHFCHKRAIARGWSFCGIVMPGLQQTEVTLIIYIIDIDNISLTFPQAQQKIELFLNFQMSYALTSYQNQTRRNKEIYRIITASNLDA